MDNIKVKIKEVCNSGSFKLLLKNKLSDSNYDPWRQLVEEIKGDLQLDTFRMGTRVTPSLLMEIVIDKSMTEHTWYAKSILLSKSLIEPYWSIHGFFIASEVENKKVLIPYCRKIIVSEIGVYGKYMKIVKSYIQSKNPNAKFVNINEAINTDFDFGFNLSYIDGVPNIYNYLFNNLDREKDNFV